jgi:hypothetical protein
MSSVTGSGKWIGRAARTSLAVFFCLGISVPAVANVPDSVSFQGVALDPDGGPLNGKRDVVIRIFDQPANPANLVYQETHPSTAFLDGVFHLAIGTGNYSVGDFALAWGAGSRWLEVEIAGEVLSPRTRFHSVPYAQMCRSSEGIAGIDSANLVQNVSPGAGLGGGGTGESVTLFVDFTQTQRRVAGSCPSESSIRQINADGSVICEADSGGTGDITAVTNGAGLVGGGASGDVSLAIGTNMVTSAMIQNGAIASVDIAANAIDSPRIASGAVTSTHIATDAVGSAQIADFSVGTRDVQLGSLNALHVAPESLSSGNIWNEAGGEYASGEQILDLRSTDTVVRSVVIDAPSDGIAIVFASGSVEFMDQFSRDGMACSITTSSALDFSNLIVATEGKVDDQNSMPFSATRGFHISQGLNTYNLVCDASLGQVRVRDVSVTAIFLPTQY